MSVFIMGLYTALCVTLLVNLPGIIVPYMIDLGVRSGDAVGITVVTSLMSLIVMVLFAVFTVRQLDWG